MLGHIVDKPYFIKEVISSDLRGNRTHTLVVTYKNVEYPVFGYDFDLRNFTLIEHDFDRYKESLSQLSNELCIGNLSLSEWQVYFCEAHRALSKAPATEETQTTT